MKKTESAGVVIQIMTAGTLDTTGLAAALSKYGPIDALKADKDITVDGTPGFSDTALSGFPILAGQWDPTTWSAITAITASSPNVWAGWKIW